MSASAWTTPAELVTQVQRLWDRGEILRAGIQGEALFPKQLRLRRPTARDLGERFDEVRRWIRALEEGSREHGYVLEFDEVDHRQLGTNQVPGRVLMPTEAAALRIIGKTRAAERFRALREQTVAVLPALADWIGARPLKVLEHEAHWDGFVLVLQWFARRPRSGLYRRQLEIEGVDTKFIETHRQVLADLLELVLPAEDLEQGSSFDRRFGLREKPALVRFRILDEAQHLHGLSDLSVPATELAKLELGVEDVIVTENEVNGLALLPRPRTLVVFGQGYALEKLGEIPWLATRRLFYWGDIDTHGFAMLDRFRGHFPRAQSLLMDRATFLTHRPMWVTEKTPSTESLTRLTEPENALHRELLRGTWGERLRLEQERIGFGWVREALEKLGAR
jgi:hypothetical protein